jgi:hypothetical protein
MLTGRRHPLLAHAHLRGKPVLLWLARRSRAVPHEESHPPDGQAGSYQLGADVRDLRHAADRRREPVGVALDHGMSGEHEQAGTARVLGEQGPQDAGPSIDGRALDLAEVGGRAQLAPDVGGFWLATSVCPGCCGVG